MKYAIINTTIVMTDHLIPNGVIVIEDGKIVPPKGFWDKYDFTKSSTCDTDRDHTNCAMVEVVDKNADNYLYKLGFVELINADSLFLHKPHTPNYRKGS